MSQTGCSKADRVQSEPMGADYSEFETRIVEIVFPNQTNHYGTLFGGHALELMDKSAFITASRFARKSMVTASSERIDFKTPVKRGHLVEIVGRIARRGETSVTVSVDLFAEDLLSGERSLCVHGQFVLVAVDQNNRPIALDSALT
ncbi:MAG TPA: acyl-CoA thioesterase [Chroococcales cyanobacterium]